MKAKLKAGFNPLGEYMGGMTLGNKTRDESWIDEGVLNAINSINGGGLALGGGGIKSGGAAQAHPFLPEVKVAMGPVDPRIDAGYDRLGLGAGDAVIDKDAVYERNF